MRSGPCLFSKAMVLVDNFHNSNDSTHDCDVLGVIECSSTSNLDLRDVLAPRKLTLNKDNCAKVCVAYLAKPTADATLTEVSDPSYPSAPSAYITNSIQVAASEPKSRKRKCSGGASVSHWFPMLPTPPASSSASCCTYSAKLECHICHMT